MIKRGTQHRDRADTPEVRLNERLVWIQPGILILLGQLKMLRLQKQTLVPENGFTITHNTPR
jgi:hypothetical protein